MFKGLAGLALLLFAGGYMAGAFGPSAYSRTVSRPPAEVMAALEDLDLTAQPGAPGSTAAAAGGVKPLFRLEKGADRMTWFVMSGDKVATAMTATFEPVDGGKATLIHTSVARGDAPDDFVSPAFRSESLTTALFSMAVEGEVNKLVAPKAASAEDCQKLIDGMTGPGPMAGRNDSFADGAKSIMRLHAMDGELRRHGCNTNDDGSFRSVEDRMGPAASPVGETMAPAASDQSAGGAPYVPGQPMLDPTPTR